MALEKDSQYTPIQGFGPTSGVTLPTTYTPVVSVGVKLGADVTITIDGVAVDYAAGDGLILVKDITYTLSLATPAHLMKLG